jgi:hypothetical protein
MDEAHIDFSDRSPFEYHVILIPDDHGAQLPVTICVTSQ